MSETVTRLRGTPVVDPYSQQEIDLDWTAPDALPIDEVAFDPGGSQEPTQDGRSSVITQPTVYVRGRVVDVTEADRIVARGTTYQVVGDPAEWRSFFSGSTAGQVIKLKAVEG